MSNLSVGQHKQLLTAVLGYLQDLQAHAPAGAVADALELNNAICSLGAASGLTTPAERTSYDIQPHTLISIFNAAGIAAPATTAAKAPADFEANFAKYVNVLKERQYFAGTVEGTPEYQALLDKARAKLLERHRGTTSGAASSATAAPSSAAPVEVSEESRVAAEELKTKGNKKMQEKDFAAAIQFYDEAIAIVPTNAVYFANRAAAHSEMKNHELAVADARSAIANDPKYAKAYSRLGLAHFALGNYHEAIEGYEKALQLDPTNQLVKDALVASRAKIAGASSSSNAAEAAPSDAPGAAAGSQDFSGMLQNLMGSLGGGGGAAGGNGGAPDLGSILGNPQFMQMASQMAQSPGFQQMAQQLSSNPDLLNNLGNMFGNRPPQ